MLYKKIHIHLKRKIHKNRWMAWAIVAMILSAATLVSYIEVSDLNFEREVSNHTNRQLWQSYRNYKLGFSLRFPPDWGIESDGGMLSLSEPMNESEVTLTVFDPVAEPMVRKALNIQSEEKIKLDGRPAKKIENLIAPEALEKVILVTLNDRFYRITGFGSYFDTVVSTLKFLNR